MTLVALPSELWFPPYKTGTSTPFGFRTGRVLDVAGDSFAVIFEIPNRNDGKAISTLGVRIHVVTAAGNVDARVEGVDLTSGDPDGSLATANSNKVQAVLATGWNEFALTANHTVAAGDLLAIVFVAAAVTNVTLSESRRGMGLGGAFPYMDELIDPSAAWVKTNLLSPQQPSIAVGYSDGTWEYIRGCVPVTAISSNTLISTGIAEAGLEFQIPFSATLTAVVGLIDRDGDIAIHVGTSSYVPGDSGATRLSTQTFDKDVRSGSAETDDIFQFTTPVELAADTTYRITIDSITATNVRLLNQTVNAAAMVAALGAPTTWKHIVDNEAGGWTTTPTKLPLIHLGFGEIHDGAAGGGTVVIQSHRKVR